LLTRLTVVNFDTESTPMRVLIKADWSDNNSTLVWKNSNDIRSFHLQVRSEFDNTFKKSYWKFFWDFFNIIEIYL
jgi:hypothetical protein